MTTQNTKQIKEDIIAEFKRLSSCLSLPTSVEKNATHFYSLAIKKRLHLGRGRHPLIVGSIYIACRQHNTPRTKYELMKVSGITEREIKKSYMILTRKLKIKVKHADPIDYIPRFASILKLDSEVQLKAFNILKTSGSEHSSSGKDPANVAAAALYLAANKCGKMISQMKIEKSLGIWAVVIRKNIKELNISAGMKSINPADFIPRLVSDLQLSNETQLKALEILKKSENHPLFNRKHKISLAVAALYIATNICGEKESQEKIIKLTGVSMDTIWQCCEVLQKTN